MATARTEKAAEAKADAKRDADKADEKVETSNRNPNDTGSDPLAGAQVEDTSITQPVSPQLPLTVKDEASGVDRIISTPTAKWAPAEVDPDPAEVARLEKFHKEQEALQEEARKPLSEREGANDKPLSERDGDDS